MAKESHITFAFHIDNRPNRYGRYSIYVRVTQHKKHKHIKTSVEVANKSWFSRNAKFENWIKTRDPEAAKKNETLAKELDEVKQAYSDIIEAKEVVTPHRVKAKVEEGPVATSFMEFVREHNESLHANGQIRYWKQFRDLYNKLELFYSSTLPCDSLINLSNFYNRSPTKRILIRNLTGIQFLIT